MYEKLHLKRLQRGSHTKAIMNDETLAELSAIVYGRVTLSFCRDSLVSVIPTGKIKKK